MEKQEDIETTESAPSYGSVTFSRITSSGSPLFGSDLSHSHMIALRINRAERHRHNARTYYHSRQQIIEVLMSDIQFAELLTSMNAGSGVPCTISYHVGEGYIKHIPTENERQKADREIRVTMQESVSELHDLLKKIIGEPKIPTRIRTQLGLEVERVTRKLSDQLPWIHKMFQEKMDETVVEAKSVVESYVLSRAVSAGIQALEAQRSLPSLVADPNLLLEDKE